MPVHWEVLTVPPGTTEALTRAVLLLAGIALARVGLAAAAEAAGRLPGRLGGPAGRLGRALRPGAARRLLAGALGLGLSSVPTAAGVTPAAAQAVDPTAGTPRPAAIPAGLVGPARSRGPATTRDAVVAPGDTLWDIARRHLPAGATDADVARAWPRWYAANRAVIGPDPALIRPGTRLRLPDRRSTGTSTSSHDRPSATRTGSGAVARSLDPDRR